ncbi:hypothetical protein SANTM175S_01771 [Streptomyces antimycoticus]
MKLKAANVISSAPPHTRKAARRVSVRPARQVSQIPAASRMNAAGSSQAI